MIEAIILVMKAINYNTKLPVILQAFLIGC